MTRALATVLAMLFLFSGGLTTACTLSPRTPEERCRHPDGPLTANDRDLLVKVRQAGLWEMPMGELTATKARTRG